MPELLGLINVSYPAPFLYGSIDGSDDFFKLCLILSRLAMGKIRWELLISVVGSLVVWRDAGLAPFAVS